MADVCLPASPARASRGNGVLSLGVAARGLHLAAAPTFAVMALLTHRAGGPEMLCAPAASPLTGMVAMYLLMSAFHLAPWLRLIAGRRHRCGP